MSIPAKRVMSTQQNQLANHKTLCGIPFNIGRHEIDVESQEIHQTEVPNGSGLSTTQGVNFRPSDDTVVWYDALDEADKQIKGLQLHETLSHPPFVLLSMNDNSFFLFELVSETTSGKASSDLVKSIRITRLVDSDVENLAPPSIRVKISPTTEDRNARINLKFAIAVCYGALDHIRQIPRGAYDPPITPRVWQRLFALALFTSVVRQQLPIDESLLQNISTVTAVDKFCRNVLSRERVGRLLWTDRIVEEVYHVVCQGIHKTATAQLKCIVFSNNPPPDHENDNGNDKRNTHMIKLIVAWLESTVNKGKPPVSILWHEEWNKTWRSEWVENWAKNWRAQGSTSYIPNPIEQDQFLYELTEDSVLSGSAAGSAGIQIALFARTTYIDQRSEIEIPETSQTKEPVITRVGCKDEPPLPTPTLPVEGVKKLAPLTIGTEAGEQSWFSFWYSARRPDLKQQGEWMPVCEAASNMAWVLGWKDGSEEADNPPMSPPGPRGGIQSQGTHLSTQGNAEAGPPMPDFFYVRRLLSVWFGRSQTEATTLDRGIGNLKPDLQKLSEDAWTEARNSDAVIGTQGKNKGKEVFEFLQKEAKRNSSGLRPPSEDLCVQVFESILKETWQNCWKMAWKKVMDDTMKDLNGWKHNTSIVAKNTHLATDAEISKLKGYSTLCEYMKDEHSVEGNYWNIRSAFKASNLLRRVLEHSVPRSYEGVMTIHYFPDRPFEWSIQTPKSKLKGINKVIHQDREELITYDKLQSRIKVLARPQRIRAPKFPDNNFAIEHMEEIWKAAQLLDAKPEFMRTEDTMIPLSRQKVPIKRNSERKAPAIFTQSWAFHLWNKTLNDLRARTFNPGPTPAQSPVSDIPAATTQA